MGGSSEGRVNLDDSEVAGCTVETCVSVLVLAEEVSSLAHKREVMFGSVTWLSPLLPLPCPLPTRTGSEGFWGIEGTFVVNCPPRMLSERLVGTPLDLVVTDTS